MNEVNPPRGEPPPTQPLGKVVKKDADEFKALPISDEVRIQPAPPSLEDIANEFMREALFTQLRQQIKKGDEERRKRKKERDREEGLGL